MKAQAAMEYLVLVGVVLLIIIPLAAYVWNQNELSSRLTQSQIAANTIAAAADNLYAQGPGAKTVIKVVFPSGYRASESSLENKTIQLRVSTPAGYNDVIATTKAEINGTLPSGSGYKTIALELVNGYVNVSSD